MTRRRKRTKRLPTKQAVLGRLVQDLLAATERAYHHPTVCNQDMLWALICVLQRWQQPTIAIDVSLKHNGQRWDG